MDYKIKAFSKYYIKKDAIKISQRTNTHTSLLPTPTPPTHAADMGRHQFHELEGLPDHDPLRNLLRQVSYHLLLHRPNSFHPFPGCMDSQQTCYRLLTN